MHTETAADLVVLVPQFLFGVHPLVNEDVVQNMSTVALGKYKSVTIRVTWILRIKVQKIIVKRRDKVGHGHTAAKVAVTDFAGCDTDVSPDLICLVSQFFYALWTNIHIKTSF